MQGGMYARLVARQDIDTPHLAPEPVSEVVTSDVLS
jgi:hypothetical protein